MGGPPDLMCLRAPEPRGRAMAGPVETEQRNDVREIRIARPERLNAFDVDSFRTFRAAIQSAAHDPAIRAVILRGEGRAFSAGGDVAVMEEHRAAGTLPTLFYDLTGEMELVIREIVRMPKPVIAALAGVAAGGGLSLALACDWRIASPEAVLVPAFPSLGAVPDGGLTYFLPHYLGIGLAQELLFTPARIPAERARELGLVHEVVPGDSLAARAWERAHQLASGPTFAYSAIKHLLVSAFSSSLESQLALERQWAYEAARGLELAEGIRAFRRKEKPTFRPA
jgi:2-(1,2-epoxy-1,2-dihydrophenyl)acetyl-CoA isomerase